MNSPRGQSRSEVEALRAELEHTQVNAEQRAVLLEQRLFESQKKLDVGRNECTELENKLQDSGKGRMDTEGFEVHTSPCLSAEDLLAARHRCRRLPPYSYGQKDFLPDGTKTQADRLSFCRKELWGLLAEERVERLGNLVQAEWNSELGKVELKSNPGKFWHTMGHMENGVNYLFPEEALYLLECASLEIIVRGLPLSIQDGYEMLIGTGSFVSFQVYAHLKRLSYVVLRFDPVDSFSAWSSVPTDVRQEDSKAADTNSTLDGTTNSGDTLTPIPIILPSAAGPLKIPGNSNDFGATLHTAPQSTCVSPPTSDLITSDLPLSKKFSQSPRQGRGFVTLCDPVSVLEGTRAPPYQRPDVGKGGGNKCHNQSPCQWNFDKIAFPNLGRHHRQTFLPNLDASVLPPNIPAVRESDQSCWISKLDTKRRRPWHEDTIDYGPPNRNVNNAEEVRKCTSWVQYKTLHARRMVANEPKQRELDPWHGHEVQPLSRPEAGRSTAELLKKITVVQSISLGDEAITLEENNHADITFDIYMSSTGEFRKSQPRTPYARVCVCRFSSPVPTLCDIKRLSEKSAGSKLLFAAVDGADISFFSFQDFKLPLDVNIPASK
uniref:tRNA-splicing endonuclease subunit Sen54-like n=1 Tax=Myxine glutinosa TaxID=7769 RepID=UPI00358FA29F